MKALVNLWFWAFFLVTAVPFTGVLVAVWLLTAPWDRERHQVHAWMCWWGWVYLHLWPGWRVEVEGRELLPPGPCVLVANHQSMADVFAALCLRHPFKFVSKASLFRVPLVGLVMALAGYIAVERGRTRSMHAMLEECRRRLRRGVAVLLFPEGTYSEGRGLLPFKRGAFRLALEEKVPVVPVVLQGTTTLVEGDGPWLSPRARVRVRVLPPLPPESLGDDDAALAERVRGLFLKELQ